MYRACSTAQFLNNSATFVQQFPGVLYTGKALKLSPQVALASVKYIFKESQVLCAQAAHSSCTLEAAAPDFTVASKLSGEVGAILMYMCSSRKDVAPIGGTTR